MGRPGWRDRWLPLLAPALLLAVACQQVVLARLACLNPWKGGGFGMFATLDRGGLRDVHAYLREDGRERRLRIPAELEEIRLRVRDLPTRGALEELGRALLDGLPAGTGERSVRIEVGLKEVELDAGRVQRRVLRDRVVNGT